MLARIASIATLVLLLAPIACAATERTPPAPAGYEKATFAGGCFWCMEPPYQGKPGIVSVTSGYIGGTVANPTYEQVSYESTGHTEAVEIVFDPKVVSYEKLLEIFWRNIDPTVKDRQFCDIGHQYRTGIFVHSAAQRSAAEASLARVKADPRLAGKTIHTPVEDAGVFYAAEDYHQDYFEKNPVRYNYYRWNCGRDQRLKQIWGAEPEH